ncbi:MAG TPA: alpha/beta hydrolase, partial [Opitutus sp.]|nr:alpha/beta hydrolase [Opitutus sp.]
LAPDRIAASVLNDIGPKVNVAGLSRIAAYVGHVQPVASWAEAAEASKATNGTAFPERSDDDQFWLAFARRTFRARDDGQLELDYDPHIALAFADFDQDAPPPDLTPIFAALAQKPMLSVRGELSDLFGADAVEMMRGLKPDLEAVTIESIGHAPMLDEPEAWDAVLSFLAKAD